LIIIKIAYASNARILIIQQTILILLNTLGSVGFELFGQLTYITNLKIFLKNTVCYL